MMHDFQYDPSLLSAARARLALRERLSPVGIGGGCAVAADKPASLGSTSLPDIYLGSSPTACEVQRNDRDEAASSWRAHPKAAVCSSFKGQPAESLLATPLAAPSTEQTDAEDVINDNHDAVVRFLLAPAIALTPKVDELLVMKPQPAFSWAFGGLRLSPASASVAALIKHFFLGARLPAVGAAVGGPAILEVLAATRGAAPQELVSAAADVLRERLRGAGTCAPLSSADLDVVARCEVYAWVKRHGDLGSAAAIEEAAAASASPAELRAGMRTLAAKILPLACRAAPVPPPPAPVFAACCMEAAAGADTSVLIQLGADWLAAPPLASTSASGACAPSILRARELHQLAARTAVPTAVAPQTLAPSLACSSGHGGAPLRLLHPRPLLQSEAEAALRVRESQRCSGNNSCDSLATLRICVTCLALEDCAGWSHVQRAAAALNEIVHRREQFCGPRASARLEAVDTRLAALLLLPPKLPHAWTPSSPLRSPDDTHTRASDTFDADENMNCLTAALPLLAARYDAVVAAATLSRGVVLALERLCAAQQAAPKARSDAPPAFCAHPLRLRRRGQQREVPLFYSCLAAVERMLEAVRADDSTLSAQEATDEATAYEAACATGASRRRALAAAADDLIRRVREGEEEHGRGFGCGGLASGFTLAEQTRLSLHAQAPAIVSPGCGNGVNADTAFSDFCALAQDFDIHMGDAQSLPSAVAAVPEAPPLPPQLPPSRSLPLLPSNLFVVELLVGKELIARSSPALADADGRIGDSAAALLDVSLCLARLPAALTVRLCDATPSCLQVLGLAKPRPLASACVPLPPPYAYSFDHVGRETSEPFESSSVKDAGVSDGCDFGRTGGRGTFAGWDDCLDDGEAGDAACLTLNAEASDRHRVACTRGRIFVRVAWATAADAAASRTLPRREERGKDGGPQAAAAAAALSAAITVGAASNASFCSFAASRALDGLTAAEAPFISSTNSLNASAVDSRYMAMIKRQLRNALVASANFDENVSLSSGTRADMAADATRSLPGAPGSRSILPAASVSLEPLQPTVNLHRRRLHAPFVLTLMDDEVALLSGTVRMQLKAEEKKPHPLSTLLPPTLSLEGRMIARATHNLDPIAPSPAGTMAATVGAADAAFRARLAAAPSGSLRAALLRLRAERPTAFLRRLPTNRRCTEGGSGGGGSAARNERGAIFAPIAIPLLDLDICRDAALCALLWHQLGNAGSGGAAAAALAAAAAAVPEGTPAAASALLLADHITAANAMALPAGTSDVDDSELPADESDWSVSQWALSLLPRPRAGASAGAAESARSLLLTRARAYLETPWHRRSARRATTQPPLETHDVVIELALPSLRAAFTAITHAVRRLCAPRRPLRPPGIDIAEAINASAEDVLGTMAVSNFGGGGSGAGTGRHRIIIQVLRARNLPIRREAAGMGAGGADAAEAVTPLLVARSGGSTALTSASAGPHPHWQEVIGLPLNLSVAGTLPLRSATLSLAVYDEITTELRSDDRDRCTTTLRRERHFLGEAVLALSKLRCSDSGGRHAELELPLVGPPILLRYCSPQFLHGATGGGPVRVWVDVNSGGYVHGAGSRESVSRRPPPLGDSAALPEASRRGVLPPLPGAIAVGLLEAAALHARASHVRVRVSVDPPLPRVRMPWAGGIADESTGVSAGGNGPPSDSALRHAAFAGVGDCGDEVTTRAQRVSVEAALLWLRRHARAARVDEDGWPRRLCAFVRLAGDVPRQSLVGSANCGGGGSSSSSSVTEGSIVLLTRFLAPLSPPPVAVDAFDYSVAAGESEATTQPLQQPPPLTTADSIARFVSLIPSLPAECVASAAKGSGNGSRSSYSVGGIVGGGRRGEAAFYDWPTSAALLALGVGDDAARAVLLTNMLLWLEATGEAGMAGGAASSSDERRWGAADNAGEYANSAAALADFSIRRSRWRTYLVHGRRLPQLADAAGEGAVDSVAGGGGVCDATAAWYVMRQARCPLETVVMLLDATRGTAYFATDDCIPLRAVGMVAGPHGGLWANVQAVAAPWRLSWDLNDSRAWSSVSTAPRSGTSSGNGGGTSGARGAADAMPEALSNAALVYAPPAVAVAAALEAELSDRLCAALRAWRPRTVTRLRGDLTATLRTLLLELEARAGGAAGRADVLAGEGRVTVGPGSLMHAQLWPQALAAQRGGAGIGGFDATAGAEGGFVARDLAAEHTAAIERAAGGRLAVYGGAPLHARGGDCLAALTAALRTLGLHRYEAAGLQFALAAAVCPHAGGLISAWIYAVALLPRGGIAGSGLDCGPPPAVAASLAAARASALAFARNSLGTAPISAVAGPSWAGPPPPLSPQPGLAVSGVITRSFESSSSISVAANGSTPAPMPPMLTSQYAWNASK